MTAAPKRPQVAVIPNYARVGTPPASVDGTFVAECVAHGRGWVFGCAECFDEEVCTRIARALVVSASNPWFLGLIGPELTSALLAVAPSRRDSCLARWLVATGYATVAVVEHEDAIFDYES